MMMREQQWDRSNCRHFRIDACLHQRIYMRAFVNARNYQWFLQDQVGLHGAKVSRGNQVNRQTHMAIYEGGFRKFCHRCYNFVNRHNRLLYYTLIERATFLLYNDAKTMHEKK